MFTIFKVRNDLEGDADPGWYDMPEGTQAWRARRGEMERDGVG